MKAYGGTGCIDPCFLNLGTGWRWVVSFTPQPFTPRGKSMSTHWLGGCMDPKTGLDVVQPVASRYTDCGILTPQPKHLHLGFWGPGYYLVYFFERNLAFYAVLMNLSITECTCSETAGCLWVSRDSSQDRGGGEGCVNYWFPMRIMQSPEGASVIKAACFHKNRENFRRS
jgi:hypothetical protein